MRLILLALLVVGCGGETECETVERLKIHHSVDCPDDGYEWECSRVQWLTAALHEQLCTTPTVVPDGFIIGVVCEEVPERFRLWCKIRLEEKTEL